jgi:predicted membrane protein
MMGSRSCYNSNLWISILLIGVGIIFLMDNLGFIYAWDILDFWPLILVAIGLIKLLGSNFKDIYSSSILIILGFLFLLMSLDYLYWIDIWDFWPVILIFIGGRIIYNHMRPQDFQEKKTGVTENRVDAVSIFGGKEVRIDSDHFEGGSITALFGGTEVRLDNARLAPGKNTIDIFIMFGGAEIRVPDNWQVVLKAFPLFGGSEDKRRQRPVGELPSGDVLIIKGFVMFGGIELKSA